MNQFLKWMGSLQKKRIHMKGGKIPRCFVMLLGLLHRKRDLIQNKNGKAVSPYIETVEKYFCIYCSELYKVTGKGLQKYRKNENIRMRDIKEAECKIEELESMPPVGRDEDAREKRRQAMVKREIEQYNLKKEKWKKELDEIQLAIATSEMETEEMILAQFSKANILLSAYREGAGASVGNMVFELQSDKEAGIIYQNYSTKGKIVVLKKKEGGAYVV